MKDNPTPALALSDAQMATIVRAAAPLAPFDRARFLEAVVTRLRGQEIGDWLVGRTCAEVQREFFTAPTTRDRMPRPGGRYGA